LSRSFGGPKTLYCTNGVTGAVSSRLSDISGCVAGNDGDDVCGGGDDDDGAGPGDGQGPAGGPEVGAGSSMTVAAVAAA
jgi:hypothetical protein